MRKVLPATLFVDPEQSRLSVLRKWVLDNEVYTDFDEGAAVLDFRRTPTGRGKAVDNFYGPRTFCSRHASRCAKVSRSFRYRGPRRKLISARSGHAAAYLYLIFWLGRCK